MSFLVKELVEENKQLEEGMKEILQAIKEMQKDPDIKGGETSLIIPSLERLVNVSYFYINSFILLFHHFKNVVPLSWVSTASNETLLSFESFHCMKCIVLKLVQNFLFLFCIHQHDCNVPKGVCVCVCVCVCACACAPCLGFPELVHLRYSPLLRNFLPLISSFIFSALLSLGLQ